VPAQRVVLTGNTIVEATRETMPSGEEAGEIVTEAGVEPGRYVLATIHRPENTDDPERLRIILDQLSKLGLPVLLPLHPRTRLAARRHGLSATAWASAIATWIKVLFTVAPPGPGPGRGAVGRGRG
jgi:UDP-N-acetylglucosamine 2-epimerase (non-hydrolysing)